MLLMEPNKSTENRFDEKHLGELIGFIYWYRFTTILSNSNYYINKLFIKMTI